MYKIVTSLFLIVGIVSLSHYTGAEKNSTQVEVIPIKGNITMTGVLLNSDKSPAASKQVFILESKKKGTFMLAFEPDGKIINQGKTNEKGRFKITVNQAFLESRRAVLCVLLQTGITPQYPNNEPLIVKPPKDTNVVDLGEVIITYE